MSWNDPNFDPIAALDEWRAQERQQGIKPQPFPVDSDVWDALLRNPNVTEETLLGWGWYRRERTNR